MTKYQAKEFLEIILNWCFQFYDERTLGIDTDKYGIRIFELLPKYKKNFPEDCFYSGLVYRKMEKGSNCPQELVACSCKIGANDKISLFSINHTRYYQSTCTNGYYLHNIVLYLMDTFNLRESAYFKLSQLESLLERTKEEAEVICFMERKNFKRQKLNQTRYVDDNE